MESRVLHATLAVRGRLVSCGAELGVAALLLGCSAPEIAVSRTGTPRGEGAPAVPDAGHLSKGDARTDSRVRSDGGHSLDAGVFVPIDAGSLRSPKRLCTGSEGGGPAPGDASDSACTWQRCPGAVALSLGPGSCVRMGDGTVRCTTDAGSDLVDQGLTEVRSLASGALHHCALRSDGTVWCWGDNAWGALGDPSLPKEASRAEPAKVPGLTNVVRIDTRDSFAQKDITCVLDRGGEVICWGGDWPRAPARVAALAGSREIAVADVSVCGLRDSATVRCVYTDGSVTTYLLNEPIIDLVAAFYMVCARTESREVFCMGAGGKPAPSLVPELSGARFLAAGLGQACALLADGTIGCSVGSDGSAFADRCEGTDVVDLRATQALLCALHADGAIRCAMSS